MLYDYSVISILGGINKTMANAKMLNKRDSFNRHGFTIQKDRRQGEVWQLHWHNCWELEIISAGHGKQMLNGNICELVPGAVYILNPTDYHEVECEDVTVINIAFSDELLPKEFTAVFSGNGGGRYKCISPPELERLMSVCDMLLYESKNSGEYSDKITRSLLDILFAMMLRIFGAEQNNYDTKKNLISCAVSYINLHFKDNPTLSDTAKFLGITPNYLSEKFHEVTEKKYKEYLNEVRLTYAKRLLLSSSLSITEICFASGFSSLSNFLRVFKARFGVSPQTMQKKM